MNSDTCKFVSPLKGFSAVHLLVNECEHIANISHKDGTSGTIFCTFDFRLVVDVCPALNVLTREVGCSMEICCILQL